MKITLHPYRLEFLFQFRIAHGMRTHTDAVFVELELDGVCAFGEATLPPYLPYTQRSTIDCLARLDLSKVSFPYKTNELLPSLGIMPSTMEAPAFAAIDMALWTLEAKMKGTTIRSLLGIETPDTAIRTYTISVCDKIEMAERIAYGRERGFNTFKLKLNGVDDRRIITDFRSLSDAPFAVDANQAWNDIDYAIDFGGELERQGCILIEQPFHKDDLIDTSALQSQISLPLIADEACQGPDDIDRVATAFTGINVKLQKCGGINNGLKMINRARDLNMKVLIGCMSESAIGCDAAEVLSPLCEWNDLDGKYLVKQVPFSNL